MIASLVIGALLIVAGLVLLAQPRVWDWANDQISLRASKLWPSEDRDRLLGAYQKILRVIRVFFGPWLLLLGLAALLVMDAQIAGLLGGVALLVAASLVQLFWRFVPATTYAMASAALFGGTGLALGIAVTDSPWIPLGAGLAVAAMATAGRVLAVLGSRTAAGWTKRTNPLRPPIALALAILSLTLGLGPLSGLLLLFGVPWAWIGGWLALCVASVLVGVWFAVRNVRSS